MTVAATPSLPAGVLFDFSGTLFRVEDARTAVTAALGESFAGYAPALSRWGAINGSDTPADLPADLADVWARRDLSSDAHRAAYSGLARHAGLNAAQATTLYDRGIGVAAWSPFPDTVLVLQQLRRHRVPTALVSNIGWDPRPVLHAHSVDELLDVLVLSDERGVQKPDPAMFHLACDELGVEPAAALMVGDNPRADGACVEVGIRFALVPNTADRAPDALLRAVGLGA